MMSLRSSLVNQHSSAVQAAGATKSLGQKCVLAHSHLIPSPFVSSPWSSSSQVKAPSCPFPVQKGCTPQISQVCCKPCFPQDVPKAHHSFPQLWNLSAELSAPFPFSGCVQKCSLSRGGRRNSWNVWLWELICHAGC